MEEKRKRKRTLPCHLDFFLRSSFSYSYSYSYSYSIGLLTTQAQSIDRRPRSRVARATPISNAQLLTCQASGGGKHYLSSTVWRRWLPSLPGGAVGVPYCRLSRNFSRTAARALLPLPLAMTTLTRSSLVLIISTLIPAALSTSNMPNGHASVAPQSNPAHGQLGNVLRSAHLYTLYAGT